MNFNYKGKSFEARLILDRGKFVDHGYSWSHSDDQWDIDCILDEEEIEVAGDYPECRYIWSAAYDALKKEDGPEPKSYSGTFKGIDYDV